MIMTTNFTNFESKNSGSYSNTVTENTVLFRAQKANYTDELNQQGHESNED
jgi:hypothetical protein